MKDATIARILFYIFKSLGLAPLTYDSKDYSFRGSRRCLIYNLTLACYVLGTSCYAAKLAFDVNSSSVKFDRAIDGIYTCLEALVCLIVIAWYTICRQKCIAIARELKALHELPAFNGEKNLLAGVVASSCLVNLVTWLSLLATMPYRPFEEFLYYATGYVCVEIIMSMMMQYSLLLNFTGRLFGIVNDELRDNNNDDDDDSNPSWSRKQLKLSRLEELHSRLAELCEQLDDFYSRPMVFCVFYVFFTLTFSAYFMIKQLLFAKRSVHLMYEMRCLAQSVHALAVFWVLVRSAAGVVRESKRTGKIIAKWRGGNRVTEMVRHFSRHLLHQNVEFSVGGLCRLDGNLLMSIVGSITTYMVILLQFQDGNSSQL